MGIADYSVSETLIVAVKGWGIVFAALITLIVLMWALMSVSTAAGKRAAGSAAEKGGEPESAHQPLEVQMVPARGSQGEIALYGVDAATAAMAMAIVADRLKTPLNELRFRSIRERETQKGADTV